MTPQEIGERLTALHTALVEKTEEQPLFRPKLGIDGSGRCTITLYRAYRHSGECTLGTAIGDSFAETLDKADAFVAALPDPATRDLHDYMAKVAEVIDFGHAKGIPVDFVNPLRKTMAQLSENVLTHQPEVAA